VPTLRVHLVSAAEAWDRETDDVSGKYALDIELYPRFDAPSLSDISTRETDLAA